MSLKSCTDCCRALNEPCPFDECRYHISYEKDLNCTLIAVDKHGPMTLREVGDRLGISFVRVKQIEEKTKEKLGKRIKNNKQLRILSEPHTS